MPLTIAQLTELRRIIEDHHLALAVEMVGTDSALVDTAEIQRLVQTGILDPTAATALGLGLMDDSFAFSMLAVHLS